MEAVGYKKKKKKLIRGDIQKGISESVRIQDLSISYSLVQDILPREREEQ